MPPLRWLGNCCDISSTSEASLRPKPCETSFTRNISSVAKLLLHCAHSTTDLVQDCSNSIANALDLLQSCAKASIWRPTRSRDIWVCHGFRRHLFYCNHPQVSNYNPVSFDLSVWKVPHQHDTCFEDQSAKSKTWSEWYPNKGFIHPKQHRSF